MKASGSMFKKLVGVLGSERPIRWICVIAYLDESGIPDLITSCVLAGHIGTEDQWKEFDQQWKIALGNRKTLHIREIFRNKKRAAKLLSKLGSIPSNCGLKRVHGFVRAKDYEDLVPDHPVLRLLLSPYMIATIPSIHETMRAVPANEHVLFVFERQDRYSPLSYLPESFHGHVFRDKQGMSRVTLSYVPKGSTPRTEPADYLAFELAQMMVDSNSEKSMLCRPILGDGKMIGRAIKTDEIREMVSNSLRDTSEIMRSIQSHRAKPTGPLTESELLQIPTDELARRLPESLKTLRNLFRGRLGLSLRSF